MRVLIGVNRIESMLRSLTRDKRPVYGHLSPLCLSGLSSPIAEARGRRRFLADFSKETFCRMHDGQIEGL